MLCDDEDGCTLEDVAAGIDDPEAGEAGEPSKAVSNHEPKPDTSGR